MNKIKALSILDKDYLQWIKELSTHFRRSQVKASVKVNEVMLRFYWELGRDIVEKKAESRWGSGFIKNLSRDLKEVNPDATCFSETNLLYMKNFYLLYHPYLTITPQVVEQITQLAVEQKENSITPQLVEQIQNDLFSVPWGHHRLFGISHVYIQKMSRWVRCSYGKRAGFVDAKIVHFLESTNFYEDFFNKKC